MSMIPMCFLILFFVGCHLTYGQTEDSEDFCDQTKGQIDSSFMLDEDTFFKIGDKIWTNRYTQRLNITKLTKPVDKTDIRWTEPLRMEQFEDDIRVKTIIDINQTIWGFNYRFFYNLCNGTDKSCQQHSPSAGGLRLSYLCLYGYKRENKNQHPDDIRTYAALSYINGWSFEKIENKELNDTVSQFCGQQNTFVFTYFRRGYYWCSRNSSLTGWTSDENFKWNQTLNLYYLCLMGSDDRNEGQHDWVIHLQYNNGKYDDMFRLHTKYENVPKIFDNWSVMSKGIDIGRTQLVIPIRFKDKITILFNCMPNKCSISDQLDDNLKRYNTIDPKSNHPYDIPMNGLSIRDVLHCPGSAIEQDHPTSDEFCERNKDQLDSSFMLDADTYFKIREKIWMSTFTKHTDIEDLNDPETDETLDPSTYVERNKHFEVTIKKQTDIELSEPIWAFNYRFLYKVCDNLPSSSKGWCQYLSKVHSPGSVNSYLCVYGYQKRISATQRGNRTYGALSYSGYYLESISDKELNDTVSRFCGRQQDFVFKYFRDNYSYCSKNSSLIGWTNEDYSLEDVKNFKYERRFNLWYVCIVDPGDPTGYGYDWVIHLKYIIENDKEDMLRSHTKYEENPQIFDGRELRNNKGIHWGRTKLIIPIRFSGGRFLLFNCKPNNCSISDQLDDMLMGYVKDPYTGGRYKVNTKGLTLKKILRCSNAIKQVDIKQTTSDELCDHTDHQLDSSFALSGDTFFKIKEKIWVFNSTKHNAATQLKDAKKRVTDAPWKSPRRVFSLEKAIKEHTDIDILRPIWAFDYKYFYSNSCNKTVDMNWCLKHFIYSKNSFVCLYGYRKTSVGTLPHTRIYGALSYLDNNFLRIAVPELEKEVQTFCGKQLAFMNAFIFSHWNRDHWCDKYSLFTGWSTLDTNETILRQQYLCFLRPNYDLKTPKKLHHYDVLVPLTFNITATEVNEKDGDMYLPASQYGENYRVHDKTVDHFYKHRTQLIIPIHFKDALILFNCKPKKCHILDQLDNVLRPFNSIDPKTSEPYDIDMRGLSLAKLLRCPNGIAYQKPLFAPQYFCHQKSFDSIFNLGNDIYFQNDGKFWRYYDLSSTKESIPQYKDNIMNIRYDSYTTTLMKQFFNISRPITGFSIKRPKECDRYEDPKNLLKCGIKPEFVLYFDMTCIYGFNKTSGTFGARPYINTPAGIEVLPENSVYYKNMLKNCNEVIEKTGWFWQGESNHSDWRPISMATDYANYKTLDGTQNLSYSVLITYYNPNKDYTINPFVTISYFFETDSIVTSFKYYQDRYRMGDEFPDGLFYYKPRNKWIAYSRNEENFKILMNSDLYSGTLKLFDFRPDLDQYEEWNPIEVKLQQLMNCTENSNASAMSYSLVSKQDPHKWICRPYIDEKWPTMVEFSILNIGEYIYYQIEQRFYRYNKTDKRFLYDKQVSELLNDLFDTTKRVIGYSYKYNHNYPDRNSTKYRAVIMGRPRMHYFARLSNETHKRRVMYRVFEKNIGPLAPLVPINHLPTKKVNYKMMENPFGFVENFCKESSPNHKCKPFSLEAEANTTLLNAITYLQYDKPSDEEGTKFSIVHEGKLVLNPTCLDLILDSNIIATNNSKALFVNPLLSYPKMPLRSSPLNFNKTEWLSRKYKRFYGMFSSNNRLYIVGRNLDRYKPSLKAFKAPMIYQASEERNFQTNRYGFKPDDWDWILKFNWNTTLDNFFKCHKQSPRQSIPESSGNGAMIFLFVFLVIALIVILIVLGIMTFMKYGSNKQKSETKEVN